MSEPLQQRVEALRRPLLRAAEDAFRALPRVPDLGASLRSACDAVLPLVADDRRATLASWRATLGRFERLDLDDQSVEVARGLRLCRGLVGGVTKHESVELQQAREGNGRP